MLRVWSLSVLVTFASFVHLFLPHVAALPLGPASSWTSSLFSRSIPANRLSSAPDSDSDPFVFPFLKVPPGYGRTTYDDVMSLERRGDPSSPCSNLDLDDLESLPGWPKLQQLVRSLYGDGEYTVEINPGGYDDALATMCVADPTFIIPTGKPVCTGGRVDIPPKNGGHEVEVQSGYMNVGNWNITHVTTAAHALFFKGTFRTPNMTTPPSGTYANTHLFNLDTVGEFINAPFNSFSTVATNMTHETKALTRLQDRTCIATINQQRCILPARGRIQLVATGYVWFNFKTKRAPRGNPYGPKRHRFSLKLEDALRTVGDRSAWIDFSGMMNTTLRTDYFDECRWNFAL